MQTDNRRIMFALAPFAAVAVIYLSAGRHKRDNHTTPENMNQYMQSHPRGDGPGRDFPNPPPPGFQDQLTSLADVPLEALVRPLKLTGAQQSKLASTWKALKEAKGRVWPPHGMHPGENPQMYVVYTMWKARDQANQRIETILTPVQWEETPKVLRDVQTLRAVGIPSELLGRLELTAKQKLQLAICARSSKPERDIRHLMEIQKDRAGSPSGSDMGDYPLHSKMDERVMEILTGAQRKEIESFIAHCSGAKRQGATRGGTAVL
jgi:hypothetical protein